MCEIPLEFSALCNGQVKWSPELMDELQLFKYLFSHFFFDRLAGRKISHLLIQKEYPEETSSPNGAVRQSIV
jgi:hypothetical protein